MSPVRGGVGLMSESEASGAEDYDHGETPEEAKMNRGYVTVFEQTRDTESHDTGERFVALGYNTRRHMLDDETEGFVCQAVAIAQIELHRPLDEDELTEWCNSDVGKLALSPFFDGVEEPQIVTEWGDDRLEDFGGVLGGPA